MGSVRLQPNQILKKENNMSVTLTRESEQAVQHFERKLNFEIGPIGLDRMIKNGEPVQVIDLRTPELYAAGHVPGALNILFENLESSLGKLNKETTTVVYCYDIV